MMQLEGSTKENSDFKPKAWMEGKIASNSVVRRSQCCGKCFGPKHCSQPKKILGLN